MLRAAAILVPLAVALGLWLWLSDDASERAAAPEAVPELAAATPGPVPPPAPKPAAAPVPKPAALDASVPEVAAVDAGAQPSPPAVAVPPADAGPSVVADAPAAAAPPAAQPALAFDAGTAKSRAANDPRFTVNWGRPGLCHDEADARRAALLASMNQTFAGDARVWFATSPSPELLAEISSSLFDARALAASIVDWSTVAPPPDVYLYESLEQLRGVSCVNASAIAYYDGAIHLAANADTNLFEVRQSLQHEYVHHVLQKQGILKPMWLHEGLAMYLAKESWFENPRLGLRRWLAAEHLPFDAMVFAFPHTSDPLFAQAAYFQSHQMVAFIVEQRGVSYLRTLVRELSQGSVKPADAFYSAVGLPPAAAEQRWAQYTQ